MKPFLKYSLIFLFVALSFIFVKAQVSTQVISQLSEKSTVLSEKPSNGSLEILNNLLIPILKIFTLLSISIGIIIAIRQYGLKVKEEIRLSKSAQSENDVKLLSLFSETIEIANGRKGHVISEKTIENLFIKDIIKQSDFINLANLADVNKKLAVATRVIPIGAASQNSAIAAIGVLGKKYDVLREPALIGLNSLILQGITTPTQDVLDNLNKDTHKLNWWYKIKNWW
jgi:hypothetical protein